MNPTRGGARQEVPDTLAEMLRTLHAQDDPMFNSVLAAARSKGWRTPVLASVLQMNPPAVSKRIERARAGVASQISAPALDELAPEERDRAVALYKSAIDAELRQRAAEYEIPDPIPTRAMIDGRQLSPERIAALRGMQQVASKVNGAMPVGHPDRRVSEAFSIALARLIDEEGFTPYYLAGVLGISHRAVTSRLERHRMRAPCPSVDGTASGVYYGRKIGDPGQGAPRLSRDERAELRELWQRYATAAPSVRRRRQQELATKLREYTERDFTLANLAQTMSTKDLRVRYGSLQAVLASNREPAGASA